MGISEILESELQNTSVVLYKEGIFWRAYEKSAFLFIKYIKSYKLTKKFYKNVNKDVVYLGFPQNSLENLEIICKKQNLTITKNDKQINISGFRQIDNLAYTEWKNNVVLFSKKMATNQKGNEIINKIQNFPLISKSPIECQHFLTELQNELAM